MKNYGIESLPQHLNTLSLQTMQGIKGGGKRNCPPPGMSMRPAGNTGNNGNNGNNPPRPNP